MIKEFNNLEEIQKYYVKETNTYVFKEDGEYIDLVKFNFNLDIKSHINARNINAKNINACDINAKNINAWDIKACEIIVTDINAWDINAIDINAWYINAGDINIMNINAWDVNAKDINAKNINVEDIKAKSINAEDINYYAFCIAYYNITCTSITGERANSFHKSLDEKIIVNGEEK